MQGVTLKPQDRIRLIAEIEFSPLEVGAIGTVLKVWPHCGHMQVRWDDGVERWLFTDDPVEVI